MSNNQAEQIDTLEQRVADLETDIEKASTARKDLAANAHEAKENAENAREIAKSATAKVSQLEAEIEDDGESSSTVGLPGGVDPATSPLDLYANSFFGESLYVGAGSLTRDIGTGIHVIGGLLPPAN